jgi:hypothetical protein
MGLFFASKRIATIGATHVEDMGKSFASVKELQVRDGGRCWTRTSDLVHVRHAL